MRSPILGMGILLLCVASTMSQQTSSPLPSWQPFRNAPLALDGPLGPNNARGISLAQAPTRRTQAESGDKLARSTRDASTATDAYGNIKVYEFQHASAARIDEIIQNLNGIDPTGTELSTAVDADTNQLIVTAPGEILGRIDTLVRALDKRPPEDQSRVRVYRLHNITAADIMATFRSLDQPQVKPRPAASGRSIRGVSGGTRGASEAAVNDAGSSTVIVPGPNRPGNPGRLPPPPPTMRDDPTFRGQDAPAAPPSETQLRLPAGEARITADESSNSLIIVAEPEVQRLYARLIQSLDRRRPQVMIEARLVLIDTSDDYSLGVELSGGDREGGKRLFAFSSFGFSDVDPVNGALSITPGTGFNGVLVDPEVADAIVRALTNHRRARVFSAPRILVNDNALGVLTSVDEVPFSSVNASNVVATTSFAGFAEAGTTIEVVPHISADDYLQLEYSVILNTFTGTGSEGIPPPRKTDEISSVVTIPDGHTVIVGGLNQNRSNFESSGIPFVENIPVIRYLGGTEDEMRSHSSLFVFLRPIILRDDKFKNLKFLTDRDARCANDKGNYPSSETLLMK